MRRDFGGRAAFTKHRYTKSDDFKPLDFRSYAAAAAQASS
jgi:hypothetical protein